MIQEKLVDGISLNFPELFIVGKYFKITFKNRGSPCYFLSSRGQKVKNITKIEQKRISLLTSLVSFFMAFLAQKLIYTINIWFNFVFGWFSEQDHLYNLFISPKCARISIQRLMQPKIWSMMFFLTLTFRGPSHRKDCNWKKTWGYRANFWKKLEVLYAELNERVEAATSKYSVTGDSLQYIYSVPVTKNYRTIRSRSLVHEFSFTDIVYIVHIVDINYGYRAATLN